MVGKGNHLTAALAAPPLPLLPLHLLAPVLPPLFHPRLRTGSLPSGSGLGQPALGLTVGQVGRGHASFAAGSRGRKTGCFGGIICGAIFHIQGQGIKTFLGLKRSA